MRSRLFIPPLANPHARFVVLIPIARRLDDRNISEAERRQLRQVARGLYESLSPAMQRAFVRRYLEERRGRPFRE
jgi:hypothetical protein